METTFDGLKARLGLRTAGWAEKSGMARQPLDRALVHTAIGKHRQSRTTAGTTSRSWAFSKLVANGTTNQVQLAT
jgi:hypothetical protein